jgi:hypothetical protein
MVLPSNHILKYNNVDVKWFIGDYNWKGQFWEAWGSCEGRPYQMFAKFNQYSRVLSDLHVFNNRTNIYFHEPTYNLLTSKS